MKTKLVFIALLLFAALFAFSENANAVTCYNVQWGCTNQQTVTYSYCTNYVSWPGGCYSWSGGCTWDYSYCWPGGTYCWPGGGYCASYGTGSYQYCAQYGWVTVSQQECAYGCIGASCAPDPCANVNCNDNNACTTDSCSNGACSNTPISCPYGQICSGGSCVSTCTNECVSGQAACAGNSVQTCGNFDSDSCLEWGTTSACSTGWSCSGDSAVLYGGCSGGSCVTSLSIDCNANNGWYSSGLCTEEYRDYTCQGTGSCSSYTITSTKNKADGTNCGTGKICSGGSCVTACTSHNSYSCSDDDVYWYNSCGAIEDKKEECNGGSGWYDLYQCNGNQPQRRYWTRGCSGSSCYTTTDNWQNWGSACPSGQICSAGSCIAACTSHSSYSCSDNDVYWYNSCGAIEDKKEECNGGYTWKDPAVYQCNAAGDVERKAVAKSCGTNTCLSSDYWSLWQDCTAGQICSAGTCISGCVINGIFYSANSDNPSNSCQICSPFSSTASWTNLADGASCATSAGALGTCQSGVCTVIDKKPTITNFIVSPSSPKTGDTITISASGSDDKKVDWLYLIGTGITDNWHQCSGTPCSNSWTVTHNAAGTYTYTLAVYDSNSQTASSSASVAVIQACTGNIQFIIEPSSISPNGQVNFIASGLTDCNGKTIEFWKTYNKAGGIIPTPTPDVSVGSCVSDATGCIFQFNAPSSEGTYYYEARIPQASIAASPTAPLEVKQCSLTAPQKEIPLGNGCKVSVEPYGQDIDDGSSGRWKDSSIVNNVITATFDDKTDGGCDGDLKFSTSSGTAPNWISISNNKEWKRGCGFMGWFCPNNLAYGFKLSISDTPETECSILKKTAECVVGETQYLCPIAFPGIKATVAMVKDIATFQTHDFIIGECLSNDLGGTSTECVDLYGISKSKCDTNTNMCTAGHGTCYLPRNLGALNNYGNELKEKTFTISSQTQDDIFKFNVNKQGRVIASLTSTNAGIGIDAIIGPVFTADYCSAINPFRCNYDGSTSSSNPTISCSFFTSSTGEYTYDATWWSGSGTADVKVKLVECNLDSDCNQLYNSGYKCDASTNTCKPKHGTCNNPKNLGALNDYGSSQYGIIDYLSSTQQNDIFKLNVNRRGYLKVDMHGPIDEFTFTSNCDWDFWVNAESYCGSETTYITRSGTDIKCDDTATGQFFVTGDKYIKVHRNSGDGTGSINVKLLECVADNAWDSKCPSAKPYCTSNKCVQCFDNSVWLDTNENGIKEVASDSFVSSQCPIKNDQQGFCVTDPGPDQYTCDYPACESNLECDIGFCCGSLRAGGPGGLGKEGQCVLKGTRSSDNKLLCA